jgi:hypothetical protein
MFALFLVVVVDLTVLISGLFLLEDIGLESKKALNPIPCLKIPSIRSLCMTSQKNNLAEFFVMD